MRSADIIDTNFTHVAASRLTHSSWPHTASEMTYIVSSGALNSTHSLSWPHNSLMEYFIPSDDIIVLVGYFNLTKKSSVIGRL